MSIFSSAKNSFGLFIVFGLSTSVVVAQEAPVPKTKYNVDISTQARYLGISNTKSFAQDNITIRASIDFKGQLEVHSLIQTGNTYSLGFNNVYDLKKSQLSPIEEMTRVHFKQIYLKKYLENKTVALSAGALDTGSSIQLANAFSATGWIDGGRITADTSIGQIAYTVGQIVPTEPDVYKRFDNYAVNFLEITLKKSIFEKLMAEVSAQNFEKQAYVGLALKSDITLAIQNILHVTADAKWDIENQGVKTSIGAQDILNTLINKKTDIKLSVDYEYISKQFNTKMSSLSSAINSGYTGGAVVTKVQFPISKKIGLNGFTNVRLGNSHESFRIESGLSKTVFKKSN